MGYTQWNLQNGAVISQRSNRASESQGARGHGQKHQRWEDKTPPLAIISTPGLTKAWAVQLGTIWASINQTLSLAYLAYPPVSKHGFYVPWFPSYAVSKAPELLAWHWDTVNISPSSPWLVPFGPGPCAIPTIIICSNSC